MASEFTQYYNLDKYTNTDKPNLRDQYNGAMDKIDAQLHVEADNITVAIESANLARDKANEVADDLAKTTEELTKELGDTNTEVNAVRTTAEEGLTKATANSARIQELEAETANMDAQLEDKITQETDARIVADSELDSKITQETDARIAADSELDSKITQETDARIAADSELDSKIKDYESSFTKSKYYNHRMVIIGDSYTYGTGASDHKSGDTKRFSTLLANMLGVIEVNVGVGSTGFCDPGSGGQNSTFQTQVGIAKNQLSATEIEDVRLVVIAGGINDEREGTTYSSSDMINAANNTCKDAHKAFPNADIIVFPMLWNGQNWQLHAFNFECRIVEGVMKSGCATAVQGCWTWNFGQSGNYASDNLHPNDTGHAVIANRMFESITNGGTTNYQDYLFTPSITGGSTNNRTYGVFQNGVMTFGDMKVGADGTSYSGNTNIGTVPNGMCPGVNVYAPIFKSNQLAGAFAITESGNVYINPSSSVNGPVYVAPFTYVPYGKSF